MYPHATICTEGLLRETPKPLLDLASRQVTAAGGASSVPQVMQGRSIRGLVSVMACFSSATPLSARAGDGGRLSRGFC